MLDDRSRYFEYVKRRHRQATLRWATLPRRIVLLLALVATIEWAMVALSFLGIPRLVVQYMLETFITHFDVTYFRGLCAATGITVR